MVWYVILYCMYLVSCWLKMIFYFKSLSLFRGIDCVYGLVLNSNQIVNIFEIFFVSDFLRIFFVSDFSFYLLTFWPLFPMIYLIFKMFDLFRSWPLQKRSKTKELWLWFLTFFVEVKNERGQIFLKINKSLGKEVKRSKKYNDTHILVECLRHCIIYRFFS